MFNVSAQAQVFGVLLILMLIIICTAVIATRGYIGILYALASVVSSIPFILTGVYMMDCLSYGNCNMFAWILVIMIFIMFTMALIWSSIIYFETQSLMSQVKRRIDNPQIRSNNNPLLIDPNDKSSPENTSVPSDSGTSDGTGSSIV